MTHVSNYYRVKGFIALFIAMIFSLFIVGGQASAGDDKKADPVMAGSLFSLSGIFNGAGIPMSDASKLAVDDINKHGGVLGRPIKLVLYDTQSDNALYAQYASQLILKDKVVVIHGGITSASREAMRPVVDRYKKLFFYGCMYEGGVADKMVFCTGVLPEQQLDAIMTYITKDLGATKIYMAASDYNWGQIMSQWVLKNASKYGAEIVSHELVPLSVNDFTSTINKIQETKPEVVLSMCVGDNSNSFYRQFAAAGLKKKYKMVGLTVGAAYENIILTPEESEGIISAMPYYQEVDNEANKRFKDAWHKKYGKEYKYITDLAASVWTGWHLWAMAVNKAGTLDNDKVIAVLEGGLEYDSPAGRVKLDGPTHHLMQPVHIARANDKHGFDIIKTYEMVDIPWHKEKIDLIKHPNLNKQFTP